MKKVYLILLLIIIAGVIFYLIKNLPKKQTPVISNISQSGKFDANSNDQGQALLNQEQKNNIYSKATNDFQSPLSKAGDRVTKKPFGMFITPQNSPVSPERFRGYHTGVDFEIFPDELDADVSVNAFCSGKLAMKKYASGYGGVAVQNCTLNGNSISVVYGHLKLASISANAGDEIKTGDIIGILGADKSAETNGERKHLHLGLHKSLNNNILGYVQNQSELSEWINPCLYICYD